jgi:pimeloyl-ACP methyl ester carboxylesterase
MAIAIDYPGYGDSSRPTSQAQATIDCYAKAVTTVLEGIGIESADMVGYHTGAIVSVALASAEPERVNKLINISVPIFTPAEVDDFHRQYATIPLDEAGTRFKIMWERILFHRGPGMTLGMCAESLADNLRAGEAYEWGHFAAFNASADYQHQLSTLKHPILVMNIDDDLHQHTLRADKLVNNGRCKTYMQWGAGFLDAFPGQVADEMLSFFDSSANA